VNITPTPNVDGVRADITDVVVAGLFTVNALGSVAVPPPGAAFVTDTLCAPTLAFEGIEMFAVIELWLLIVMLFTVMSDPKLTEVTPVRKWVPITATIKLLCPKFPLLGLMLVSVGNTLLTVSDLLTFGFGLGKLKLLSPAYAYWIVYVPAGMVPAAIKAEKFPLLSSVADCEIGPVVPARVTFTLPVAATAPDLLIVPEKVVGGSPTLIVGPLRLLKTAVPLLMVAWNVSEAGPAVAVRVGVPALLSL
jgi:hypothetical protein